MTARWLVMLGLALLGCQGRPPAGPARTDVVGTLEYRQQPAAGALLVFHGPSSSEMPPRARVQADGRFQVRGADGQPGVSAGDYVITVEWTVGTEDNGGEGERRMAPDRYRHRETSPLRVTVEPDRVGPHDLGVMRLEG
jgi:hypothetical protein